MIVDPVIVASARKHQITDARLLEIGVSAAEGIEFIVHAVPARDRFLET